MTLFGIQSELFRYGGTAVDVLRAVKNGRLDLEL